MKDLAELIADNVSLSLFGGKAYRGYNDKGTFSAYLEKNSDGISLKIDAVGNSPQHAIDLAVEKWNRITGHGIEEFRGSLLEAPRPTHEILNDEIPF